MADSLSTVSFEQLVALADGQLSPEDRAALQARVVAHPEDAAVLAWLVRIIGLMRADTSVDAPPDVVVRAAKLMPPRMPVPAQRPRMHVAGVLRFDSRKQPVAFGIRSGAAPARQLLWNAGERDIDLRITANGKRYVVAGQILGPEEPGTVALQSPAATVEAPLNELAEFVLPPVPAGNYLLVLSLQSTEIAIHDVDIGG